MPATELLTMVGVESSSTSAAAAESRQESDLDAFHRRIADSLIDLAAEGEEGLMSLRWVRRLLDEFLGWQEEFGIVLFNHRAAASRAPLDRMVADHFERSLKALDVCNAVRDGTDRIRHWQRLLEIVLSALSSRLSDGHLRRARKALVDLSVSMLDDKDSSSSSASALALAHRHRSFGRHPSSSSAARHFRSLSSSVSRSWSAAKQLQAIAAPQAPARGAAGEGLALAIQAANSALLFTMWALVAAIPCQDRGGLQLHFPAAPRHLPWAGPMSALHDRIALRRRDRRSSCGLLREIRSAERCARAVTELVEEDRAASSSEDEVRARVEELSELCSALREGLDPLERRVRDVFHRIVRSRTDGLDSLGKAFI